MIEINIQPEHIYKAKQQANELGELKHSITKGKSNIYGFIGEVVLSDVLGIPQTNTYDYDLETSTGIKIDVKTKRTTRTPLPYYECSIAAYNTTQRCDYYAFCRVNESLDTLWFLGIIKKEKYFEKAKFLRKGQIDGDNGFVVKADCYNLSISEIWKETESFFGLNN